MGNDEVWSPPAADGGDGNRDALLEGYLPLRTLALATGAALVVRTVGPSRGPTPRSPPAGG